ncbi:MAG: DUF3300 domain-containing protein [bacterium]
MNATARVLDVGRQTFPSLKLRQLVAALIVLLVAPRVGFAQVTTGAPLPVIAAPPPVAVAAPTTYAIAELDRIVSPIALYPDPLLAQVLTAATFASQIPAAAQWVDARRGSTGEQLVEALSSEQVSWDPSVQALVAFPTVLQMMATSMPWTAEIGDAFQGQHADVMDAVQRLRAQAQRYGYLQSTPQYHVSQAPMIEIVPVNPTYVVVPYYDPIVVFAPPRPHFVVSTAIYWGYGVRLGVFYEPWGWGSSRFYWPAHRVVSVYPGWNRPWNYREPPRPYRYAGPRRDERVVVTPRGYTDPRYTDRGTSDRNRTSHESDYGRSDAGRSNPSGANPGRTAQPRTARDAPLPSARPEMSAPSSGREAPHGGSAQPAPHGSGTQPAPRANGDGASHTARVAKARP